jgi:protein SCO1/2
MALLRPVIVLLLLLALGAGVYVALRMDAPPPQPTTATLLPASDPLPEVSLLDQHGNAVGADVFEGRWDLVFFGFTHCPDICPLTLQVLADARRQMRDAGIEDLPRIVLVSVDPERDTPDSLASYLSHFGDDNLGLTGELEQIRKLTGALGIFFEHQMADESGNYGVDHSAVVLLMNPAGRLRALFSAPHTAGNFVHDLPLIMSEAGSAPNLAPLVVSDVTVTGSMPGMRMSAGYMTFSNNSDNDIRITRISSPQFAAVEMHETVVENDIAKMRPIDAIVVPANGSASLQRGGKHLMLMRPQDNVQAVTLNVWSDDTLLLSVSTRIADR